jgi:P4 family phage/plasmid primase-like protien
MFLLACLEGLTAFTYSTHSHKLPDKGNRFRVVVAVQVSIPALLYKTVAQGFSVRFGRLSGKVDTSGFTPSQMLYFPSCSAERRDLFEFDHQNGASYDWKSEIDSVPPENFNTFSGTGKRTHSANPKDADKSDDHLPDGSRNKGLFQLACRMRRQGMEQGEITAELIVKNMQLCIPPLDDSEVLAIAISACSYPAGNASTMLDHSYNLTRINDACVVTELGLAQQVANRYSGQFHLIAESGTWMILDSVTKVWKNDSSGQVKRWLIEEVKQWGKYAVELIKSGQDYGYGQKILTAIKKAEKNSFIQGAQSLLQVIEGITVNKNEFDANPYIVGFQGGGCADLKDLNVRDIEPSDKLTKLAGTEYRAGEGCPIWEKSVLEWCCGDVELARFLQIWIGYCLSGLTEVQYFLFLFGGGRNGKSVFINIISALLDGYAIHMNPETLMLKSGNSGANNDVARLVGARLATSVELQEGRVFDENLIKQLTGGDKVTARYLYHENFEFFPNLKLMVSGNHKPIVKGSDFGFWRRVLLVPFSATVDKPDPDLTNKLLGELPGILNWALEGWCIYQKEGLSIPKVIQHESTEYKKEMDIVLQWLQQCTAPAPGARVRARDLYASFKKWSGDNGFYLMTSSVFGKKMIPRGLASVRGGNGVIYLDLQIIE